YYIFVLTALIYIFYGTCMLLRFCFKSKGLSKSQSLIVLFTFVFMLGMLIFRIVLKWDVETIPFTFILISYAIFYAGFKKFSLFKVVPVSMLSFLDSVEQGILVIDNDLDILSSNKSLLKMFPCLETIPAGGNIASFLDYLYSSSEINEDSLAILDSIRSGKSNVTEGKITFNSQYVSTFSIIIQPFCTSKRKKKGRIITFTDISELAELNYQLDQKNKEIFSMNEEFTQISHEIMRYTSGKQELSAAKERNRIWNELYSSIESEFSSIISFTSLCINDLSTSGGENQEKLDELNKMIKDALQKIRGSIYTQNSEDSSSSINQDLESILLTFTKDEIDIQLMVEGEIQSMGYPIRSAIFCIWQEAFKNSVNHGKASSIYVIINLKDDFLHLYILDNGKGCENTNKGSGLSKMDQMIKNLKGTITYGSLGPNEGFSINVVVPLRLG
ncbi:MAG TPA: PAS-domain containing protein, partial [Clostridia bacterium]